MHRAVFRHFGVPRKLISDRDPQFMSDFWQTLFRVVGINLSISTSYHPKTDGQTERVNQTWEQVIRCYVHPLHDDWIQQLTNAEFAINAAVSTSTSRSPFKVTL
jgi:transposase InsO family protein